MVSTLGGVQNPAGQSPREPTPISQLAPLPAGGWSRDPEVPSNLNYPLILQHLVREGQEKSS